MAKRTEKEKNDLLLRFTQQLALGYTKDEIEVNLALRSGDYEPLVNRFYEEAEKCFKSKSNLRIFVDYMTRQSQLIRDLERLKKALEKMNWKNGQAYVGAVKAQSEILDKMIDKGQDLGLIKRIAEKFVMVNGTDVRDMDLLQITQSIESEINDYRKIEKSRKRGAKQSKVVSLTPSRRSDNDEQASG